MLSKLNKTVKQTSFSPWPVYANEEIQAVLNVLHSGKVNYHTGQECITFENEYAAHCSNQYAVALANGTVALELALYALDIGVDDEVIVTPATFIASASSIIMRNATPIFADIDTVSNNISPESIRQMISPKTKAIIAVHLAGWPCEMDSIMQIAGEYGLKVIEDCAQAHGAKYKGQPVGSFGDVAAFSFCNDKIITTGGEGGMLITNNRKLWERAWAFKDHGRNYNSSFKQQHPPGFRWVCDTFGTNWRMTEMQAAIGRIQLNKLSSWTQQRREIAATYTKCFESIPALKTAAMPKDIEHVYYKYYAFIRLEKLNQEWTRDRIIQAINYEGIPCYHGPCPEIYREKAFEQYGIKQTKRLPNAQQFGETSIMFCTHPTLTVAEIKKTCQVVEKVFSLASQL